MEYAIKAPQVGEVVQHLTIVEYCKREGDIIRRDEPFIVVETEKATLDIESPVSGIVKKLFFDVGSKVPIGETLALLCCDDESINKHNSQTHANIPIECQAIDDTMSLQSFINNTRNGVLSPRSKRHCLEHKVIPIELYKEFIKHGNLAEKRADHYYEDFNLSKTQEKLGAVFVESARQVVPANIQVMCDNKPIELYRKRQRNSANSRVPSRLEIITWSTINALKNHPMFCSRLINASTRRQFQNPNIGVALALDNDNLATVVIQNVFSLGFPDFLEVFRDGINEVKEGNSATIYHSLIISDLSSYGIVNAIPVVTYPSMATLFVGKPYIQQNRQHLFHLSLSFDHRIVNGAGAALFLRDVERSITHSVNTIDLTDDKASREIPH